MARRTPGELSPVRESSVTRCGLWRRLSLLAVALEAASQRTDRWLVRGCEWAERESGLSLGSVSESGGAV